MKESDVEKHLVKGVEALGGFVPKTVWLGRRGCPDREVYWPGGYIDKVELKRPVGGRYEPGQEQAHKTLAKLGTPVYLLDTIDKVDRYLEARRPDCFCYAHLPALFSVPVQVIQFAPPGPEEGEHGRTL